MTDAAVLLEKTGTGFKALNIGDKYKESALKWLEVWLTDEGGDPEFPIFDSPPRSGVTAWYTMLITALGEDSEDSFTLDPHSALRIFEQRDAERSVKWQEKFS